MKLDILKVIKTVVAVCVVVAAFFLISYFYARREIPQGTLSEYELPFIAFTCILTYELVLLIGTISFPLYHCAQVFSSPPIAKILFKEKAPNAIQLLKKGTGSKNDIGLRLKIGSIYMLFPTLYFITFYGVAYININPITNAFAILTILMLCIGLIMSGVAPSKKITMKRWFIWLNLFSTIFATGIYFLLAVAMLYFLSNQHFSSDWVFVSLLFRWVTFLSSFGLINLSPHQIPMKHFRLGAAIVTLVVLFIPLNLFYTLTADNLQLIGQKNIPVVKFQPIILKQNSEGATR